MKLHTCLSGLVSSMFKSKSESFNPPADTSNVMVGTTKFLPLDVTLQNISSKYALYPQFTAHTRQAVSLSPSEGKAVGLVLSLSRKGCGQNTCK